MLAFIRGRKSNYDPMGQANIHTAKNYESGLANELGNENFIGGAIDGNKWERPL